jgi:hypothetical protein
MARRELRILPYKGDRDYQYYLDGLKVNGKRKRLFFKTALPVEGREELVRCAQNWPDPLAEQVKRIDIERLHRRSSRKKRSSNRATI